MENSGNIRSQSRTYSLELFRWCCLCKGDGFFFVGEWGFWWFFFVVKFFFSWATLTEEVLFIPVSCQSIWVIIKCSVSLVSYCNATSCEAEDQKSYENVCLFCFSCIGSYRAIFFFFFFATIQWDASFDEMYKKHANDSHFHLILVQKMCLEKVAWMMFLPYTPHKYCINSPYDLNITIKWGLLRSKFFTLNYYHWSSS